MNTERLQKIIESCHINFLIGSGASKDYLETLWNIEDLLTKLDKEKDQTSDTFKLLETSIKYWYFERCIKGNLKLCSDEFEINDIKQEEYELTSKGYRNLIKSLNVILLKRKTSLLSKQINIFTTNMDIFLDRTLDSLGVEYNDGFAGKFECVFMTSNYQKTIFKSSAQYDLNSEVPLFNLFKLHGSLTWNKSVADKITYDTSLSVLTKINNIDFSGEQLIDLTKDEDGNLIYKSFADLKLEAEKLKISEQQKFTEFKSEYDKLVMINPTKEKFENTTLRLEYYEQMRMYSNILEKENSVLFVTGFSFADEHIRQITLRALNSNPTLLVCVFCYNQSDKEKIDELFPALKFNNLYSEFVNYNFHRTAEEIFGAIAKSLDSSFYGQKIEIDNLVIETNVGEENGSESK